MKAKTQWAILLMAIMVFSMAFAALPLSSGTGAMLQIDGNVSDWATVAPVAVDAIGDTYPWSKNPAIVCNPNSTTAETLANVAANDAARDIVKLAMYFNDPTSVYILVQFAGLYPGYVHWSGENASKFFIFMDVDPGAATGMADSSGAADYRFDMLMAGEGFGWDLIIQGDAKEIALMDDTWAWLGGGSCIDGWGVNMQMAVDWAAGAIEMKINRGIFDAKAAARGVPLGMMEVIMTTCKYGECWGSWGDWDHAFDPQAPGSSGEPEGWDGTTAGGKPACVGGFGPTAAQIAADGPYPVPAAGHAYKLGFPPGVNAAACGPATGDPTCGDLADILNVCPAVVFADCSDPTDIKDQVTDCGKFQVDTTIGAMVTVTDAATGSSDIVCRCPAHGNATFTVNISLCNALDAFTYDMDVMWDPTILQGPAGPAGGGLPNSVKYIHECWKGSLGEGLEIYSSGKVEGIASSYSGLTGLTDPGCCTLFQLTFTVLVDPPYSTTIKVHITTILNGSGDEVSAYVRKAEVHCPPPPPAAPTAIIEEDAPPYYVGTPINIWSDSLAGYNGTQSIPIANETWTIVNSTGDVIQGPTTIVGVNTSIVFTPPYEGDFNVTLTVMCEDDPILIAAGLNTASAKATKHAYPIIPSFIDCWTERERWSGYTAAIKGKGPNLPADAYALDEEVTLYAIVVYKNWPQVGLTVAFELYSPLDPVNPWLVRTATTNASGIATITFRLPATPNYIGVWTCLQKVYMCQVPYEDILQFHVGYIVTASVTATDVDLPSDTMNFEVTLTNMAQASRNVFLVITVYDDNDAAIVTIIQEVTAAEDKEWCEPFADTIVTISGIAVPLYPSVRPGLCKVYVNIFNKDPAECGHPWGPEAKWTFMMTAPPPVYDP